MKYTAEDKLKNKFDDFISRNKEDFEEKRVDYLGVNIASDTGGAPVFKIYYNNKSSRGRSHPLIDFLESRGMVRYVTMVQDKKDPRRFRVDIGLKNRTNENMQAVYEWLNKHTQMFRKYSEEIKKLSGMKVTDLENHDYAGLYFLGFIAADEEISMLKCHYFNRICKDPDVLHKVTFADEYYLDFLANAGIREFADLSAVLKKALALCGGHLWMTGADYSASDSRKYKIYIKNPDNLYEGLLETFAPGDYEALRRKILDVREWNQQHEEFYCEGFAVCRDEQAVVSINFYFRMKKEAERIHE